MKTPLLALKEQTPLRLFRIYQAHLRRKHSRFHRDDYNFAQVSERINKLYELLWMWVHKEKFPHPKQFKDFLVDFSPSEKKVEMVPKTTTTPNPDVMPLWKMNQLIHMGACGYVPEPGEI